MNERQSHAFFQGFPGGSSTQNILNTTPELQHNFMVLEIYNNWDMFKEFIDKIQNDEIKQVDVMQNEWLQFLNTLKININDYKTADEFLTKHEKQLANEVVQKK